MTKMLQILAGAIAAAALACGGTSPQTSAAAQPENLPGKAAIRFLGANTTGCDSVLLAVQSVDVTVDGVAVPLAKGVSSLELTQPNQAWLLATFDLPPRGTVHATVKLAPAGTFTCGGAPGTIDARGPAFELEGPAASFAKEHHGVFVLDVGRSLLDACAGAKMLVPQLKIAF